MDLHTLIDLPAIEPIDIKEVSGMNELIQITIEKQNEVVIKQTEMINKQSETINQISKLFYSQQEMIEDGKRGSIETRIYSIFSIVLAIIAIVISIIFH
ncbi:hypothetical protein PT065_07915 [Erysipelothrix rhusiopathiae]|nr:hypothetical protein [Erysipelothrix rhusiopathiae]